MLGGQAQTRDRNASFLSLASLAPRVSFLLAVPTTPALPSQATPLRNQPRPPQERVRPPSAPPRRQTSARASSREQRRKGKLTRATTTALAARALLPHFPSLLFPLSLLALPCGLQAGPTHWIGRASQPGPARPKKWPSRPCLDHRSGIVPDLARPDVPCRPNPHRAVPGSGPCRAEPGRPLDICSFQSYEPMMCQAVNTK